MCLVLKDEWLLLLLAKSMAPQLSSKMTVGWLRDISKKVEMSVRSQRVSTVASERAFYSASVVDNETVGCFWDCQETGHPRNWQRKPE